MMPSIVVGHCNAAHPGRVCGQNPFFRVFQYDAFLCLTPRSWAALRKISGGRFNGGHIQTADNDIKKMRNIKAR
jgi:hypothetical protein